MATEPSQQQEWSPEVQAILAEEVTLENGDKAPIISEDKCINSVRFICNICRATVNTVANLFEHVRGGRHARSLNMRDSFPFSKYRKMKDAAPAVEGVAVQEIVDLAPGEPVPPGFEDEVHRLPQISLKLEHMKSALVGLEFLAEVTPADPEEEPRYLCMLCDKKGDKRTVLAHLISFNHRIRYIQRFFPRTMSALEAIPKLREYRRGTGEILTKIITAIEAKHGRLQPVIIEDNDFEAKKPTLFQSMMQGFHFIEKPEDTFDKLVLLDEIKRISSDLTIEVAAGEEANEAKRLSATTKTSFKHRTQEEQIALAQQRQKTGKSEIAPPIKSYGRKNFTNSVSPISSVSSRSRSTSRSPKRRHSRTRSRHRSRSRSPVRRNLPYRRTWSRSLSRSRSRSRSKSRIRRHRRYSPYRRSPRPRRSPVRRSPVRRAPWRGGHSFATSRPILSFKVKTTPSYGVKELEAETARKEKIKQFKLYSKALSDEMAQKLRTFEKTPEKHPQYSDEWKKFWNKRYKELTAEGKDAAKYDFKPEWIKFWTVRIKELNDEELTTRLKSFRTELGLEDEMSESDDDDDEVLELPVKKGSQTKEKADVCDINIIHVLRLLAALEVQLGSLGPKVNNLLSEALAVDKIRNGNAERLLDLSENVVLFETAKEKLKGQLFAGVIERHLTKGTKKAIAAVAELLTAREKKLEKVSFTVKDISGAEPLVVPGVGTVDKLAIAEQIATALIAQGRTDLSEFELEQLINAVVGMAQVNHAAAAEQTPEPAPTNSSKDDSSKLKELLSFVVQTQANSAKPQSSSLTLLQNYEDNTSTADASQLSDNDLKTLLQNFDNLSGDEQRFLANYLALADGKGSNTTVKQASSLASNDVLKSDDNEGRLSPFSSRIGGANPSNISQTAFEDDDDNYSYGDIVKAAKKNVKRDAAAKKPLMENTDEASKKLASKGVAEKMIREQEKKSMFGKIVPAPAVTKPSVLIDPNDLFANLSDTLEPVVPKTALYGEESRSKTSSAKDVSVYMEPQVPEGNPVMETEEQGPPPVNSWDGYSYGVEQCSYNNYDQGGNGYGYVGQEEPHNYGGGGGGEYGTWADSGFHQPPPNESYAGGNGYGYHAQSNAFDVPPPNYPPPPSNQYHSYY